MSYFMYGYLLACGIYLLFIYLLSMSANSLGYIGSHGKVSELKRMWKKTKLWVNWYIVSVFAWETEETKEYNWTTVNL
jgi:hypothetical protein